MPVYGVAWGTGLHEVHIYMFTHLYVHVHMHAYNCIHLSQNAANQNVAQNVPMYKFVHIHVLVQVQMTMLIFTFIC